MIMITGNNYFALVLCRHNMRKIKRATIHKFYCYRKLAMKRNYKNGKSLVNHQKSCLSLTRGYRKS